MKGRILPAGQRLHPAFLLALLLGVLAWVYWPSLVTMVQRWSSDPQYTHGYVVPIFALIVLWLRRDRFPADRLSPSWLGVPLLVAAGLLRLAGSVFAFEWLEAGSLLPALVGVSLLVVGPAVTLWAWPVAAFLVFILPWPFQFDMLLTHPLRRVATVISTYALQTLGIPALARGNIIQINDLEVGVVEACSGLGMLMTFFALSTAVALVIQRPTFDRVVIFLSAAPIGVLMNVGRITVTVFLYQVADAETARVVFHDVAGWVMMPLALVVLWLELCFLGRLWRPAERRRPVPVPNAPAGPTTPVALRRLSPTPSRPEDASVPGPREREGAGETLQEIPDVAP
jgi:exosortase